MSNTYSPGDRSNDPGSRYGTCLRESDPECRVCCDTGIEGGDEPDDTRGGYCQCDLGRYLARVERGEA